MSELTNSNKFQAPAFSNSAPIGKEKFKSNQLEIQPVANFITTEEKEEVFFECRDVVKKKLILSTQLQTSDKIVKPPNTT